MLTPPLPRSCFTLPTSPGVSSAPRPLFRHTGWRCIARTLVAASLTLTGGTLLAHRNPNAPFPSFRALRVDAPLVVDGRLDEPFWAEAQVASGFVDARTHRPAELQTTTRIAYTDTYLYVAVECFDDRMDEIRASERRQDRPFSGDDWIELHFDPGHSHRAKYAFFSNPLGTRADANEGPSGVFNYGWSAEWDLAADLRPDRWVLEFRIPFSIMNYQRRDGQTWGVNVTRQVRRTDALSFLSFNATDYYKPRYFGHLTGLDLAATKFQRDWEVTPYVSTRVDFNGDTDTLVRAGLDASVRLTPAIRSSWALHPDFGQVEADEDTIELRDTERFLPEKRLFFREGDELMRMTHRLYYSRRFTDITAAAQASGQGDGFSFNALNIHGNLAHRGGHRGNSTMLRLLQDVGERSSIGYYLANSELKAGHARALGLDATFFLTDAWKLNLQAAGTDERLSDAAGRRIKDRTDHLGHVALNYDHYPWRFSTGYQEISRDFNPLLGFIPRRNAFGPFVSAEYGLNGQRTWFKRFVVNPRFNYFETDRGRVSLRDYRLDVTLRLANDLALGAGQDFDYHAPYRNTRTRAEATLFAADLWRSATVGWAGGTFERVDYHELFLGKPLKLFTRWMLRPSFNLRFEDLPSGARQTVWLNRLVFDFSLTERMWIKSSVQHRNAGVHNISVIYGWEFRPNTHWYAVYNSVRDAGRAARDSAFTKITYTF